MYLLRFYTFMFYRLKRHYDKWKALILIITIIGSHFFSFTLYYVRINNMKTSELIMLYDFHDYFLNRARNFIFFFLPFLILFVTINYTFKNKIKGFINEFRNESIVVIQKREKLLNLYYLFSVVLFLSAILSPLFII